MKPLNFKEIQQLEKLLLKLDDDIGLYADTLIDLTTSIEKLKDDLKNDLKTTYKMGNLFTDTTDNDTAYFIDTGNDENP